MVPRHLGPEYIIHGAKLYSPWDPTKIDVTLVVSEWFFDRSLHLIKNLDEKDHPFSEVIVMAPPVVGAHDDYDQMTNVKVTTQHRGAPDFMDLCEADVKTDWFMITNSYHNVARHVDLMFTPGTFKPVIPFTPATYPFCFKFPYCKETISLAQRIKSGHDKVVLDMDMLYNTKERNAFCKEWREENGEEGEDLYKNHQRRLMFRKKIIGPPGPTGTSYLAWLAKNGKDGMYKMTDRALYGARPPFIKVFAKEEKLDGMSEDELVKRVGMTMLNNSTEDDCNCGAFETEIECEDSGIGCMWRPLFESCHPPELIDGSEPICSTTEAPTMAPTLSLPPDDSTESPTAESNKMDDDDSKGEGGEESVPEPDPWYTSMFKSREHEQAITTESNIEVSTLDDDDDEIMLEPYHPTSQQRRLLAAEEYATTSSIQGRKLTADMHDLSMYKTNLTADNNNRMKPQFLEPYHQTTQENKLEANRHDAWYETKLAAIKKSIRYQDIHIDTAIENVDTMSSFDKVQLMEMETLLDEQEAEIERNIEDISNLQSDLKRRKDNMVAAVENKYLFDEEGKEF